MTKLETIPAEEGALLPQKPQSTGIRRVVVAAAVASFVIGVLAATAVTSPGRHASNLHSKHEHETTAVDDEGPHPFFWDDARTPRRRLRIALPARYVPDGATLC